MTTTPERAQYLTFIVAGEEYAVEILRVREIVETMPITQLPATPAAIRGVVNLRGTVVPVIDPGVRFGLGPRPITWRTCIVFVEIDVAGAPTTMGLIADAIGHVIELGGDAIEPVPPFGSDIPLEFLSGMGAVGRKFVHLLNVDRVLSLSELAAVASLAPTATAEDDGPGAER
jgi:purine-binding chemotaxis protein CheW